MANLDKYEVALHKWIAKQANLSDWTKISNVEFDQEWSGGCETCGYDYVTLTYTYDGRHNDLGSIRYDSPAKMIREVAELVE